LLISAAVLVSLSRSPVVSSQVIAGANERNIFSSVENGDKKIALTFDDGPHEKYTAEILDILKEENVPATFFVIGENAKSCPELIKRELAEGHEIGNHTYSHMFLKNKSSAVISREILDAETALYEVADYRSKLLRPPGGLYDSAVCASARECDYSMILWSVDTRDWAHTPAEQIAKSVLENVKSGDIILMHDYISGKSPTPKSLRAIIPKLKSDGFTFVTVSELISSE
jgi:polysaccharide deacetylase family sporulation protein PdaB